MKITQHAKTPASDQCQQSENANAVMRVLCAVTVIEIIKLLSVNHFVNELFYNYILYKYKYSRLVRFSRLWMRILFTDY